MAKDFIDLKNKLARQILQKLPKELSQDKTEQTLYRLSYCLLYTSPSPRD